MRLQISLLALALCQAAAFAPSRSPNNIRKWALASDQWDGEVVANEGGAIRGCSIQQIGDSVTDWSITIDG